MSVLNEIAFFKNRRDEIPNQELAKKLAVTEDITGIKEIAGNLWNKNKNIQSDCLKVLYEIGYLKPDLIGEYVDDFLKLLSSKNNRMVWGAMIALATIAKDKSKEIWNSIDNIERALDVGSVITVVWGIKALAVVSSVNEEYSHRIFPFILKQLKNCEPKLLPKLIENTAVTVNDKNKEKLLLVVSSRKKYLKENQLKKINKILNTKI